MRKSIVVGAAVALSLALAGTAQADTVTTTFDGFANASVHGQDGWLVTNSQIDQAVVGVPGDKALRISNAVTFGSFGDMPHSKPVIKAAGENEATNVLVNEFTVKAPDTLVPGLVVSVSPDDGQGSRMSYLRLEDKLDGVHVIFMDASFNAQEIATLPRSVAHTIKFETTFVKGDDNDVVRIFIDGEQEMRGASWENYYRSTEERNPSPSDRLIIRTAGTAAPLTLGGGFLFDNVTTTSSHANNPAPLNPPAPGPVGPKGDKGDTGNTGVTGAKGDNGAAGQNGTNGVSGKAGVNGTTTVIREYGTIAGASMRTLHIRKIAGMKFIGAKATLSGKKLRVKGRTIKVNLRGKSVGEYRVNITAKYKANGKVYKVRSVRSLSIIRK